MNVLVLYQSRKGHTQIVAKAITQAVSHLKYNVKMKSVIEVAPTDIENADVLFVGTWVQGFIIIGVKPAGAEMWVPKLPSIQGKAVGIFCTYAFNPRNSLNTFGAMLTEKGAHIVGQQAFHRNRIGDNVETFVQSVLQASEKVGV